jgi:hypothetical protein
MRGGGDKGVRARGQRGGGARGKRERGGVKFFVAILKRESRESGNEQLITSFPRLLLI